MLVIVIKCFLSSTIPFAFLKGDYTEIQVRKVKNQGGSVSDLKFFCLFIYLFINFIKDKWNKSRWYYPDADA